MSNNFNKVPFINTHYLSNVCITIELFISVEGNKMYKKISYKNRRVLLYYSNLPTLTFKKKNIIE